MIEFWTAVGFINILVILQHCYGKLTFFKLHKIYDTTKTQQLGPSILVFYCKKSVFISAVARRGQWHSNQYHQTFSAARRFLVLEKLACSMSSVSWGSAQKNSERKCGWGVERGESILLAHLLSFLHCSPNNLTEPSRAASYKTCSIQL